MRAFVLLFILLAATIPAAADTSPYRGMETRGIKALSEQEIADLQAGRGMGLALAAELNGYPGPRHVLDLVDPLGLTAEQTASVRTLFDAMQAEATALGALVVAGEAELERGFREAFLDAAGLDAKVMRIADLRGRLRAAHLRYHLATRALLDRHQLALYDRLRGYDRTGSHQRHGH